MVKIDVDESIILEALTPQDIIDNFEPVELLAAMEMSEIVSFLLDRGIDFLKDVEPEDLVAAVGKDNLLDAMEPEDAVSHYGDEELLDIILSNRKR